MVAIRQHFNRLNQYNKVTLSREQYPFKLKFHEDSLETMSGDSRLG